MRGHESGCEGMRGDVMGARKLRPDEIRKKSDSVISSPSWLIPLCLLRHDQPKGVGISIPHFRTLQ